MRLDHIAYRVKDRYKTAKFMEDTLGSKIANEFTITFQDKTTADCIALTPPEDRSKNIEDWNININPGLITFPPKTGFNLHAQLTSVHFWHHNIRNDKIRHLISDDFKRFLSIGGNCWHKAPCSDYLLEYDPVGEIVIHDEDGHF